MIICAGNNEIFDFAQPTGVGLIETTMNLTRLCMFDKPEFLLFVGTAGSYGKADIFDIVESKTAANIELAFLNNDAYTPLDNVVTTNETDKKDIVVNSSNYISTNFSLAKNFLKFGVEIENMEFFAVLKVAQEFDIPAGGVFCITNFTNKNAHEEFVKNHEKAKELLTTHVKKRIKELTRK
ncbi:MAG: purine-nucleoside phosphorylase [Sulfurimonas sp.]